MRGDTVHNDVPATDAPTNYLELHRKGRLGKAYKAQAARQGMPSPGAPPAPARTLVPNNDSDHSDLNEIDLSSLQAVINQVRGRLTEVEAQLDHASSLLQERNLQTTAEAQINLMHLQQQLSVETWVHDQYLQTLRDTCKPSKDQTDRIVSSLGQLNARFAVRKAADVDKHELQMVCGQLHFSAQTAQTKLSLMMDKYTTLLRDFQAANKCVKVLQQGQGQSLGQGLLGSSRKQQARQRQEAAVQCDLASSGRQRTEASVQCGMHTCSYSEDQVADILSQLEASEQQVDMLKRAMVTMTRVATLLVHGAEQKQDIQQQMWDRNLNQSPPEPECKPHSPQIYQPADMVPAVQKKTPEAEQQGVVATQHVRAVLKYPIKTLDGTFIYRRCSTDSSGCVSEGDDVPQQQGDDNTILAVQHSLESLAVHDSAVQHSLKSLGVPAVLAVQQSPAAPPPTPCSIQGARLAGQNAYTAPPCGLGASSFGKGQHSAVQFTQVAPQAVQRTAIQHRHPRAVLSDMSSVQQEPYSHSPHANNADVSVASKAEVQDAASETGSPSGLGYIPALAPPPAAIQDWLRMQLITLADEDTNLLQSSGFGPNAGADASYNSAAVGVGSGAAQHAVGVCVSAEEEAVLAWLQDSVVSMRASGAAAGLTGGVCLGGDDPMSILMQAADQRVSLQCTEDEELAPVASNLMLRLSETNSTLKAREAEVASLQAQNALLRQQVEQQQQQLDAVHVAHCDSIQEECGECEGAWKMAQTGGLEMSTVTRRRRAQSEGDLSPQSHSESAMTVPQAAGGPDAARMAQQLEAVHLVRCESIQEGREECEGCEDDTAWLPGDEAECDGETPIMNE